ncbi:hypothetical protein H6783_01390 [Candidatus Nomurabacteria bacterium]|nr:hypothetical protein [Candidatus Nomurabacteria bacterium]
MKTYLVSVRDFIWRHPLLIALGGLAFVALYVWSESFGVATGSWLPAVFGLGGQSGSQSGSSSSSTGGYSTYSGSRGTYGGRMTQTEFGDYAERDGADVYHYDGYSKAYYSDGSTSSWSSSSSSSPYLLVWNGKRYLHENDFLFGKPTTVFTDYAEGYTAYRRGIGGDSYLVRLPVVEEDGKLRFQIREIEPEESFIDRFCLQAIDLHPDQIPIVDGSLGCVHVFDAKTASLVADQTVQHYHRNTNTVSVQTFADSKVLRVHDRGGSMLETGDEIIIQIPRKDLTEEALYVVVDSYFRDWTLGETVPFSYQDRLLIYSRGTARKLATTAAGVSLLLAGMAVTQTVSGHALQNILATPYANADVPPPPPTSGGGGGTSCGGMTTACSSKSLEVSVMIGGRRILLQTLFPRLVQASKEVVCIPKDLVQSVADEVITICIKATKRHQVTFAGVMQGQAVLAEPTLLGRQTVVHTRTGQDVSEKIRQKNEDFLHIVPGDTYEVTVSDMPTVATGLQRHILLSTNGFYTRLSEATKRRIGANWYRTLAPEDKAILRSLKQIGV